MGMHLLRLVTGLRSQQNLGSYMQARSSERSSPLLFAISWPEGDGRAGLL